MSDSNYDILGSVCLDAAKSKNKELLGVYYIKFFWLNGDGVYISRPFMKIVLITKNPSMYICPAVHFPNWFTMFTWLNKYMKKYNSYISIKEYITT